MSGRWQIKNPGLRPLAAEAAKLVARFAAVTFEWIPRERNKAADALANRAMDEAAGKPVADAPRLAGTAGEAGAASLGAAVAGRRHPADPGPARRDRADQAGPLLRPRRRPALRRGRRPRRWPPAGGWPASPGTSRPSSRSPLGRCVRTAELDRGRAGRRDVTVLPDLIECDFGEWEGLTFAEVQRALAGRDGDAGWTRRRVAPPGGESFEAVAKRARAAVGDGAPRRTPGRWSWWSRTSRRSS